MPTNNVSARWITPTIQLDCIKTNEGRETEKIKQDSDRLEGLPNFEETGETVEGITQRGDQL